MGRDTFGPHLAVGGAHIAKVNAVINSMDSNSALPFAITIMDTG
jgi:hypothetical protein